MHPRILRQWHIKSQVVAPWMDLSHHLHLKNTISVNRPFVGAIGERQTANGERQTAGKRQTANGKRQTANGPWNTACFLLFHW